jgi:hypothetical protein
MNSYFLRKSVDPQFEGIKRNYEIIERKIKDFQEKSNTRGRSEIFNTDEEYYPNASTTKMSIKESLDLEKSLQYLKDVSFELWIF